MDKTSRGKNNYPPRILEYRKQIRTMTAFTKYLSYLFLLLSLVTLNILFFMEQDSKAASSVLFGSLTFGIPGFILYLSYSLSLRPLAIRKFQVYHDRIFIKSGKKEINIRFDDVIELKSSVKNGWFTLILKNKKKYRFFHMLERVDYVLDAIVKYNPKLIEQDKYLNLRKRLILTDHDFNRKYDMFRKKYRLITFAHGVLFPVAFFTMLYIKQSDQFIVHSPFLYFMKIGLWTFVYMTILEAIFRVIRNKIIIKHTMKRLENDITNKTRDTKYESKIYRRFFPAYITLLLVFFGVIYITDLNTLGTTSLSKGSEVLSIRPGERLWYDSRYNCTDCNYKLKPNDLVITYAGIGKIVALPNETVAVNMKDKKGRSIASVEEKQVPQKSIAIKTANGKTIIVGNKHIRGKVFKHIPHFK